MEEENKPSDHVKEQSYFIVTILRAFEPKTGIGMSLECQFKHHIKVVWEL